MPDNYDESSEIDPTERPYHEVYQPEEKPKDEWNVNQRRAFILDLYTFTADLKSINKTELADDFDISRQMVHNDIGIIKEWHRKHKGYDFEEEANKTFKWGLKKARKEENLKEARNYVKDWAQFLFEEGERDKKAEKVDIVNGSMDISHGSVEDDEE